MKGSHYFPHDYDARQDIKVIRLMAAKGVAGLGIYWSILEELYKAGGKLPLSECESIAFALHLDCNCIASVVQDFDLFQNDGKFFWSESVLRRIEKRQEVSTKRTNAAKKRWEDASAMQMQCKTNAKYINDINISSNEDNREKRKRFVPPTLEEVQSYVEEKGLGVDAVKFFNFYESKGWYVGKNKMKSWHAAVANWERSEDERRPASSRARRNENDKNINDVWK